MTALSPAHAAASYTDPALSDWYPSTGSADSDLLPELGVIRPRARDLERNNGYGSGASQTYKDNIVGHQLRLNSNPDGVLLGWDRPRVKQWALLTNAQFATWAHDPNEIDAARSMSLLGLTIQGLGGWFSNGDAIAIPHWLPRDGSRWNTRIQVIEADRLATPPWLEARADIRGGVQIDQYGAPVGYWVRKSHPGDWYYMHPMADTPQDWRFIPAFSRWGRRRVIHLHDRERAGANRSKPILSAIMREFRMATHYTRTELQATIANSLIAAFIESAMDQETVASLFSSGVDQNGQPVAPGQYWKNAINEYRPTLKSGAVIPLPIGAKLSSFTPGRPNAQFDQFMRSTLHHIGAGLNIPYELLSKDFSRTNYSSARAALLEAWRFFQGRRRWLIDYWLNPIYELWLEEAFNAAVIEAPGFYTNGYAYRRCRWIMAGRGWVDPSKEADAVQKRMAAQVSTLEQECAEQGLDWREVLLQQAEERELREELGLPQPNSTPPSPAGVAGNQSDQGDSEDQTGEGDGTGNVSDAGQDQNADNANMGWAA